MLTTVLLTNRNVFTLMEQAQTALVMLSVLFITFVVMLASGVIVSIIGTTGRVY